MNKAIIFGASGYTGIELTRILSVHPEVRIVGGSSRNWEGKYVSEMFPFISADRDFRLSSMEMLLENPDADIAFLALPHGESVQAARILYEKGIKTIDLSADLRLNNAQVYRAWYSEHNDPALLDVAVYGLPEINRDIIRASALIANPGCYPQTAILGLNPLLDQKEVDCSCPIVDAKSGVSGAGRGAKLTTSFCECGEGFKPYGVIGHRHIPEMEQELSKIAKKPIMVRFTPHLIPVIRGMVSTIYIPLLGDLKSTDLRELYREVYKNEPFIRILSAGHYPDTSQVRGSNQCHISVDVDERTRFVVITVAIDNLVKGASGSAVQNMNLLLDLDETTGLASLPLFP
jgi:N-acetyl-gamma-glutamyl-phosphate reductase